MQTYLVVGGAGYIGSHMVKALLGRGHEVITLDDLSKGHREAIVGGDVIEGDLGDRELLGSLFSSRRVDCVMHFAAFSLVGESVEQPLAYYLNNTGKTASLLLAMKEHGVGRFIFSSTAAVYGEPESVPIMEGAATEPTNPYGRSKLTVEKALADCETAHGLRYATLRYFNAAGADPSGAIGEDHSPETHLIPIVLQAASGKRESIAIFGDDWDTPDGTCVRDYVHVNDLVDAHILAAEHLLSGGESLTCNLGCENCYSVREIIDISREVTGREIKAVVTPRRPGDPARLVASSEKIRNQLGWRPSFDDPRAIIETAWKWHSEHPEGYSS